MIKIAMSHINPNMGELKSGDQAVEVQLKGRNSYMLLEWVNIQEGKYLVSSVVT